MGLRLVGLQGEGPLKGSGRALQVALLEKRDAQVAVNFRGVRLEGQRLFIAGDRLNQLVLGLERIAKVKIGHHQIGIEG